MESAIRQDVAVVIDLDAIYQGIRDLEGDALDVEALLAHFSLPRGVRRVLRRVHAIVGRENPGDDVIADLQRAGVDVHFARAGRPDCKVFAIAAEMTECHDVIVLCVASGAYVPLLRHIESLGSRVELHVLPNVDPKMLPVAGAVVALPISIAVERHSSEAPEAVAA